MGDSIATSEVGEKTFNLRNVWESLAHFQRGGLLFSGDAPLFNSREELFANLCYSYPNSSKLLTGQEEDGKVLRDLLMKGEEVRLYYRGEMKEKVVHEWAG